MINEVEFFLLFVFETHRFVEHSADIPDNVIRTTLVIEPIKPKNLNLTGTRKKLDQKTD